MGETIIDRSLGLNTKLDQFQTASALDLAVAENVVISDSGVIEVAIGHTNIKSTYPCHSLFCDGGDAFVVEDRTADAALSAVTLVNGLVGVRSGLMKGRRMSYCQVGDKTYYTNGVAHGVVLNMVSSAWPDQTEHFGVDTTRVFYPAPVGSHIAYSMGCWWIAKGNTIFVSEFRLPGKFDLFGKRFTFGSDVRMVRPVLGGVWVSDSKQTGFINRADDFKAMQWAKKSATPAHEWSDACQLQEIGSIAPGLSAVWSSDDGQCVGTHDGQLFVITEGRLNYPSGGFGATIATDDYILNSVW